MTTSDQPGGDSGRGLYGLEPGDFTAARNALAKRLRAEGDKEAAAVVAKLRRPPATAWALNKVAREQSGVVAAVLDAGAGLRAATEEALRGDASSLRTAQAWERRAVDAATAAAASYLTATGQGAGDVARQRMAGTLRAAMVDATVAAALRAGILDDDREAPGFGLDAFSPAAAGSAAGRRAEATKGTGTAAGAKGPATKADAVAVGGAGEAGGAGNENTSDTEEGAAASEAAGRAKEAARVAADEAAHLASEADEAEVAAATAADAARTARADAERAAADAERLEGMAEDAMARAASARTAAHDAAEAAVEARRAASDPQAG